MGNDNSGFELRDHTADIALFVWGDSLESLFRAAAHGLYATVGQLSSFGESMRDTLRFEAADAESLLHDFLAELLFRMEIRGVLLSDFDFARLDDTQLVAAVSIFEIDQESSVFDREVKAITYHDLRIVERGNRYEVTLILDI